MGTSTRNRGQNGHNPLIPTWLEGNNYPVPEHVVAPDQQTPISPLQPIEPNADPYRFRGPRTSIGHFISGRGQDTSYLKRGISHYVSRSLGGSANATRRLGSSRTSTARLYNVLYSLSSDDGQQRIARFLSLDTLEGLPASSFFIQLAQFICPDGGPEDEGISRSAYYDTIADNPEMMEKEVEQLTIEEIDSIVQRYMSKIIMQQIMNGIANNAIRFPENLEEVSHIEEVVEQLIDQSVSDAYVEARKDNVEMTNENARQITDGIYQKIFEILEELGD